MPEINKQFSNFTEALRQVLRVFAAAGIAHNALVTFLRVVRMGRGNMCWNESITYVGFQFRFEGVFCQFRYDWDQLPKNEKQAAKKPYWGSHINFTIGNQAYGFYWPKENSRWEQLPAQCKKLPFSITKDNDDDPDHWKGEKRSLSQLLRLDPTITNPKYEGNLNYEKTQSNSN